MDIPADQLKIWTEGNWEERRYGYKLYHDDLLIDLGAYSGEWAAKMYNKFDTRVIAVEPTSAITHLHRHPGITVINKAAWTHAGVRSFGGNAYWTSANEGIQDKTYECFNVMEILDQSVAILKINIEGDEYPILWNILFHGKQLNIDNFQIQFHQVGNYQEEYDGIVKILSQTHEKTWGIDWVWENWKRK